MSPAEECARYAAECERLRQAAHEERRSRIGRSEEEQENHAEKERASGRRAVEWDQHEQYTVVVQM